MSLDFSIYSNDLITAEELYEFVVELGGTIHKDSNGFTDGNIQISDECIIVYYDDKLFFSEFEKEDWEYLIQKHQMEPTFTIGIHILSNSKKQLCVPLAKWFCKQLLIKYPNSIIEAYDTYYSFDTINKIPLSWQ